MKAVNIPTFLAVAASSFSIGSAYERELADDRRLGMGRYSGDASSKFAKYLGIYDRCCVQTFETLNSDDSPCKCPVRTFEGWGGWFDFYSKWEEKCDSRVQPKSSIAALAASDDDFSILLSLVGKFPTIVDTLTGPGALTVFAPTNAAFEALLATIPDERPLTDDEILSVLTYHVVDAKVPSIALEDEQVVTTLGKGDIIIDLDGGVSIRDGTPDKANVNPADLFASNGVVHVIDKVLIPPGFRSESISK